MDAAKFSIGQIIHHRLFDYHGVIIDVDYRFLGSEQWYEHVACSQPPKDQPWYHVLVGDATHQTYVAERNLEASNSNIPIHHPFLEHYFSGMKNGHYQLRVQKN